MALIFCVSSIPATGLKAPSIPFIDKAAHLTEYIILGILITRALFNLNIPLKSEALIFIALFASIFYGITDEIHQLFVPGRSCDIFDFFFDCLGVTIGTVFYLTKMKKV